MENKFTNIKERVLKIAENKGIAKEKFFFGIGMSYGSLKGAAKKRPLNSDAIENILTIYKNINPMWLITGKGSMLKEDTSNSENIVTEFENYEAKEKLIPMIPIEAMAGFGNGDVQVMDYDMGMYKVPDFDTIKVDFMIRARGSSMYPKYNSGDTLACLKVSLGVFFQWNKVYVLDTSQGAMVKRVKKSKKENHILCVSDNPNYDPFDLPLNDLYAIALVVGVIRLE